MLAPTMLLTMFEYSHATNNRLLDLAAQVTPEQWDAPQEAGQRSLHRTLHHLLAVEEEYLHLFRERKPIWDSRSIEDFPTPASLRAFSDQIYAAYLPYVASLTENELTTRITSLMPSDRVETVLMWHIFVHMILHSAQHRSECAYMLTRYGFSPGFIDFYGFGSWGDLEN